MATKPTAPNEPTKSVFQRIRESEEHTKSLQPEACRDIQKRLQSIADDIKQLKAPNFLTAPEFGQALAEMNLMVVTEKPARAAGGPKKDYPPVKDTELGLKIAKVVKDKGKTDAPAVIAAIGSAAKPATTRNYLQRLVVEGVLYRPNRGEFAVK